MSQPVISVENLSKAYRLGHQEEVPDTIMGAARNILTAPWRNFRDLRSHSISETSDSDDDTLWALKDVSFEVNQGDVVGIIGRNGAGKSTLLKILSRITEPTSGRAVIRGRVSSLLEVGTGFHPELSGRDNVYMNGTILGMTKREIDRKFDEIVEFSGVEKFLDTPAKRYSSGMQVRLAFAVAAHLEPEILIIDEVLAVGDMEFQKRCLGKMQNVASTGRTVIFVSHNLQAVRTLCTRGITLSNGEKIFEGNVENCVTTYAESGLLAGSQLCNRKDRKGSGECIVYDLNVRGVRTGADIVEMGDAIQIDVCVENKTSKCLEALVCIAIEDSEGTRLFRMNMTDMGVSPMIVERKAIISCCSDSMNLLPGRYQISVGIIAPEGSLLDEVMGATLFSIVPANIFPRGKIPMGGNAKIFSRSQWVSANERLAI